MFISRIIIRNFRNFESIDVNLNDGVTTVIGENNSGKTNLLYALRLLLDSSLSSQFRTLGEHDLHCGIDFSKPEQVVISVEFNNYTERDNECALVGLWEISPDVARLCYRFRPKKAVIEDIEAEKRDKDNLTLEDYEWELTGGGDKDPAEINWNEDIGSKIRFGDLQQFHVVFLPALRDVQRDLKQSYTSPLSRLFSSSEIPEIQKKELIDIIRSANEHVANKPFIKDAGNSIKTSFSETAGEAYEMDVRLGMADPSFASISRALTILLSNNAITDFEPSRNGLGLNNILYISMLLEYFKKRVSNPKTAGQLLLIEEPEAHLHPQLQRVLFTELNKKPFQTILTTHSTHISSQAPLMSVVCLTNNGSPSTLATVPAKSNELEEAEISDLERYLDATKSTLLFARKVILVEGPAELFLIPPLVKHIMGVDFDRLGISTIPIYGTHFNIYTKLFSNLALPKKCVIIADGDLSASGNLPEEDDDLPEPPNLESLKNESVGVFQCTTTFERALTIKGTLLMLAKASEECGAINVAKKLRAANKKFKENELDEQEQKKLMGELRKSILNTALRFGKARFAQIAAKHVKLAKSLPRYIKDGVNWLIENDTHI